MSITQPAVASASSLGVGGKRIVTWRVAPFAGVFAHPAARRLRLLRRQWKYDQTRPDLLVALGVANQDWHIMSALRFGTPAYRSAFELSTALRQQLQGLRPQANDIIRTRRLNRRKVTKASIDAIAKADLAWLDAAQIEPLGNVAIRQLRAHKPLQRDVVDDMQKL